MKNGPRAVLLSAAVATIAAGPAMAQKPGGILRIQHWDSPAGIVTAALSWSQIAIS